MRQTRRKAPHLPKAEAELLLKVNQGLPPQLQQRFDELVGKRQAETLTAVEQQELIQLTDRIEQSDAERVQYLAALARLRGTSLTTLLNEEANIRANAEQTVIRDYGNPPPDRAD